MNGNTDPKIDISSLTVDQLRELLRVKILQEAPGSEVLTSASSDTCSFIPKRANQVACTERAFHHYGGFHYCKKHGRTVQAINAKKEWEDQIRDEKNLQKAETFEPLPEPSVEVPVEQVASPPANAPEEPKEAPVEPRASSPKVEPVLEKKKHIKKTKSKPMIVKRVITANKWGRFEDRETGIVFDPDSKSAYGIQNRKNGRVDPLTKREIEICNRYKWKYTVVEESSEELPEKSETHEETSESETLTENISENSEEKSEEKSSVEERKSTGLSSRRKDTSGDISVDVCDFCKKETEECVCDDFSEDEDEYSEGEHTEGDFSESKE